MTMGVYAIRNTKNGNRYVGSSMDIERRVLAHVRLIRRACKATYGAWWQMSPLFALEAREYGVNAFEVDVLEEHADEAAMREREKWYIRHTRSEYNRMHRPQTSLCINYKTESR